EVAVFVGVAGGLKDVAIGDVVVGTKIYNFLSGKAVRDFQARPDVGQSNYELEQRARADRRKDDWLKRLAVVSDPPPTVHVAPIAAGDQVVASTRSATFKFLRKSYGDAVAVVMEGSGFLRAVRAGPVCAL